MEEDKKLHVAPSSEAHTVIVSAYTLLIFLLFFYKNRQTKKIPKDRQTLGFM